MDVSIEKSKDNNPVIKVRIFQKELYLSSRYYPFQEAEKLADKITLKTQHLLLVGLGNPYLVFSVSKKNPEKEIMVIEPSEEIYNVILSDAYLKRLLSASNIKVKLIRNTEELKELLSDIGYFEYYINPQYKIIFEFISTWEDVIKKTLRNLEINRNTLKRFGSVWTKNLFLSSPYIPSTKGIKGFFGVFKGVNSIVVGAGPSLDETIDFLKEFYDSFLVISVDTSWRYLVENKVKPDIVITVDPQLKNFIYNLTSKNYENTIFVCDTLYPPIIYRYIPIKNILIFDSPLKVWQTIKERFGLEKGTIEVGGSVVCSAIDLAYKLGSNTVILIGVDLGFPNQKIYSKGNYYEIANFLQSNVFLPYDPYNILSKYPLVEKTANNGTQILTDPRMITFKNWIENYISTTNISVINLSQNGLYINNTKTVAKEEIEKVNVRPHIENLKELIIETPLKSCDSGFSKELKEMLVKVITIYHQEGVFGVLDFIDKNVVVKYIFEMALQSVLLDDYTEQEFLKELENKIKYFERVLKYF